MNNIGITNFLFAHAAKKPASFHMPGHKGTRFYKKNGYSKFMKNIADYDIILSLEIAVLRGINDKLSS